jgi:hypothetical protein
MELAYGGGLPLAQELAESGSQDLKLHDIPSRDAATKRFARLSMPRKPHKPKAKRDLIPTAFVRDSGRIPFLGVGMIRWRGEIRAMPSAVSLRKRFFGVRAWSARCGVEQREPEPGVLACEDKRNLSYSADIARGARRGWD